MYLNCAFMVTIVYQGAGDGASQTCGVYSLGASTLIPLVNVDIPRNVNVLWYLVAGRVSGGDQ